MSRLSESKARYIEELKQRGAEAGKEIAENDLEYEHLLRLDALNSREYIGRLEEPLPAICEAMGLTADEIFGEEYESEMEHSEFLKAFVDGALGVFRSIE